MLSPAPISGKNGHSNHNGHHGKNDPVPQELIDNLEEFQRLHGVVVYNSASPARAIAEALASRAEEVLFFLFPAGKVKGHEFCVGSLAGEEGASLKVSLNGKGCVWSDFATGDTGGDLLDLWAAARCRGDLKAAMREASNWLGLKPTEHARAKKPSGSWTYHDENGAPWIIISRFDSEERKEFFPYDQKAKKRIASGGHQLPDPRPLYDLHTLPQANDAVLFCEGERCAEALKGLGFTATTTMGGALAAKKSDYSALAGKTVIVWPDNDGPGERYAKEVCEQCLAVGAFLHLVPIPPEKPEGWDAADAVGEGWTREGVLTLLKGATLYESHPKGAAPGLSGDTLPTPKAGADHFRCTDLGNGERLVFRYGSDLKYCNEWKRFLIWSGKRREADNSQKVRNWRG